jgi:uncharacterized protein (TIGR03435 family)
MRITGVGWRVGIVLAGCFVCGAAGQTMSAPPQADVSQETPTAPQFEVATIKPSDPANCCGRTWGRVARRFSTENTNLRWLIRWAYGLNDKQIVGGPAWMEADRFDVSGESDGTKAPTDPEWRVAMQKLLADRFQLRFHHESREMSAYVLSVARGGAKLTKSDPEKDLEPMISLSGGVGQTMHGFARDVTLAVFMGDVQRIALDRPVVDRTGLTGTYDIAFEFSREEPESMGMTQLPDNAPPNLITALEQQLGLKLERAKAAVDVLAIDRAEPPSAN